MIENLELSPEIIESLKKMRNDMDLVKLQLDDMKLEIAKIVKIEMAKNKIILEKNEIDLKLLEDDVLDLCKRMDRLEKNIKGTNAFIIKYDL